MPTPTPWGVSQNREEIVPGIVFHSTAGHGGFEVCEKLNDTIPDYMRNENGWYEEDCEWCKIAVIFPEYFLKEYASALSTLRNWYPDEYQKRFGVSLRTDESHILKKRAFIKDSINKYIVVSAIQADSGMVECHAVKGGRLENGQYASGDHKAFLVPEAEYKYPFVIDIDRHKERKEGRERDGKDILDSISGNKIPDRIGTRGN